VRINGFDEERDRPRLVLCGSSFGNGYFRFAHLKLALAKFAELAAQPETRAEELNAQKSRQKNLERIRAMIAEGKIQLLKNSSESGAYPAFGGHPVHERHP
jgi:hypothetical protein